MTRLQESLFNGLEALRTREPLWEAFMMLWSASGKTVALAKPQAFFDDCLQRDPLTILRLMVKVAPKMSKLGTTPAGDSDRLREVAIGICLVACERYILQKYPRAAAGAPVEGMLIDESDAVAAALIAAVWSGIGVKIGPDTKTQKPRAITVLPQHAAPSEFLHWTDRDRAKAEVHAMVNAAKMDLASFDRLSRLKEIAQRGLPNDDEILRGDLQDFAEEHLAHPIFGLSSDNSHPMLDQGLRSEFAKGFGVHTFLFAAAAKAHLPVAEAAAWKTADLQAGLLNYLGPVFEILYPKEVKPMLSLKDLHFRVALSFAGEHRPYIRKVALALTNVLGIDGAFYDDNFAAQLSGPNTDLRLQNIYHQQTDLVVVFLSGKYQEKEWCGLEMRTVRDQIMKRDDERIMFFRFDDEKVDGVYSIDFALDCRKYSEDESAKLILERLAVTPPKP